MGAPDLAVEVLSHQDRPGALRDKVAAWLDAGARAVWVVDPRTRTVAVHERGACLVVEERGTLTGDPVLPEFTLPVREIFVARSDAGSAAK